MTDAISVMNSHGLYPGELVSDGQIHRFKVEDSSSKAGWYVFYESGVCVFGNFKTGLRETFKPNCKNDEERKKQTASINDAQKQFNKQKEENQIEVAKTLSDQWLTEDWNFTKPLENPYFIKKKLAYVPDIRIKDNVIYIPLYQPNSDLKWSYQRIFPNGEKKFTAGGKAKGGFFTIDSESNITYLCEGFATGVTIYMATKAKVICCFSASGIIEVARSLPKGKYIIAADDDQFNTENAGRKAAIKASELLNAPIVYPQFKDSASKPTDFNDLLCLEGIDAVGEQLKIEVKNSDPDDFYKEYAEFFKVHLKNAKKDIIRKKFVTEIDGILQPVINQLGVIKSHAKSNGLKPSDVEMHLERYVFNEQPELMIDIPKWDGVDRIKELGQFVKLKTHPWEVFEDAFKEWLANIFRRLYTQHAQNRCIILKGDQGIGKDNLVRNLLGGFGCYYSKFTNNRDERAIWDQVVCNLVVHIEEFDQTGSMGVAFLKDIITRDLVTYRSSFERANATQKCHGSFISTVNIDAILRDETGNRRFAVFEIDSIDWAYPKDWSPQIMAQSKALYESDYRANKETWELIKKTNSQFEQVDLVPELLNMWDTRLGLLTPDDLKNNTFSFNTIQGVISDMSKASGWKQRTILTMLKTHGRSQHSKAGTRYQVIATLKLVTASITDSGQQNTLPRKVKNYAPSGDRSPNDIDHHIDHHLSTGDDVPF